MFQYRQALARLRTGDTVREIARLRLMGRDKLYAFKTLAERLGWLERDSELPDDATLAAALGTARRASSTVSSAEPLRDVVQHWCREWHSVITNAHVRRWRPSGCCNSGPAPKSTWAASPGAYDRRTVTSGGRAARRCRSMRTTAE
jgi:hypothetical protein